VGTLSRASRGSNVSSPMKKLEWRLGELDLEFVLRDSGLVSAEDGSEPESVWKELDEDVSIEGFAWLKKENLLKLG
jgi:hypothetical protein